MDAIELSAFAGLPLRLDGQLRFGNDTDVEEIKSRARGELGPVAYDPEACRPPGEIQYRMYNGIARQQHVEALRGSPLRYELTLMLPKPLGRERAKTVGHIHNAPAPTRPTFPEIFQVVHGVAHFLFYALRDNRVHTCNWTEVRAGGKIIAPPDLYHLTINAGDEALVFADLIPRRALAIYDEVRASHGAPYFELDDGNWVPNPRLKNLPPLEMFDVRFGEQATPLYTEFTRDPGRFAWLDEPELFIKNLPKESSG
jgi:glucose-6-phosphate isomerase